jgi:hypothetical protein
MHLNEVTKMRILRFLPIVLLVFVALAIPATSSAQIAIGLSVRIGPPALPVYVQPACPGDGFIWTPGYWYYANDDYFWVPGTWVRPPRIGLLWTPGWWGWEGGLYRWRAGYWGPHVGFYGGINYGFGYGGVGFFGGMWEGGVFRYNTAVTNVNVNVVHNTYINKTVINNNNSTHTSFNGGSGGVNAQPTAAERTAENEHHVAPTSQQTTHETAAKSNPSQFYGKNHGSPTVTSSTRAGQFGNNNHSGASDHPLPVKGSGTGNGNANGTRNGNANGNASGTHNGKGTSGNSNSTTPKGTNTGNPSGNKGGNGNGNKGRNSGGNGTGNKGGSTGGHTNTAPKNPPPKNPPHNNPPHNPPSGTDPKGKDRGGR